MSCSCNYEYLQGAKLSYVRSVNERRPLLPDTENYICSWKNAKISRIYTLFPYLNLTSTSYLFIYYFYSIALPLQNTAIKVWSQRSALKWIRHMPYFLSCFFSIRGRGLTLYSKALDGEKFAHYYWILKWPRTKNRISMQLTRLLFGATRGVMTGKKGNKILLQR